MMSKEELNHKPWWQDEKYYHGDYWLAPDIEKLSRLLTQQVTMWDEKGVEKITPAIKEKSLTIFLNNQEVVTAMTIGDYPDYLAIGFLMNQKMLSPKDNITKVDVDDDLGVVVVRTEQPTDFEIKSKKKIITSGCGMGTIFGDIMDAIEDKKIISDKKIKLSHIYRLLKNIALTPSLYLVTGAIHGAVLAMDDEPKIYVEDVGRHNAVDKIAGYMKVHHIKGNDKIFYTTGRLTSEMVIKCLLMDIPILLSRNGFTLYGLELAKKSNLTMIARARGDRLTIVSGKERIIFDE